MTNTYDNTPKTGKMFARRAVIKLQEQGAEGGQYDLILLAAHRAKKVNKKGKPEQKLHPKYYEGTKSHVSIVQEIAQGVTTFEELKDEYINDKISADAEIREEEDLIRQ